MEVAYVGGLTMLTGGFLAGWMDAMSGESADVEETVAISGLIIAAGSWVWSIVDAPISASRINERGLRQHGHLIELDCGEYVLGVDPCTSDGLGGVPGARITLHF